MLTWDYFIIGKLVKATLVHRGPFRGEDGKTEQIVPKRRDEIRSRDAFEAIETNSWAIDVIPPKSFAELKNLAAL